MKTLCLWAVLLPFLLLAHTSSAQPRADFSDADCKAAFLDYMNRKATAIGMTQTHFSDGSGIVAKGSAITPTDALRLAVCADAYPAIHQSWGADTYYLTVEGPRPRTLMLIPRDRTPFTNHYQLLGAKTGTLQGCNNAMVVGQAADGRKYIVVVLNSTWTERWRDARKLMDIARRRQQNADASVTDIRLVGTGAAAMPYPFQLPLLLRMDSLSLLYQQQGDVRQLPASVTKAMTAICMLDWVQQLDTQFEIKQSDLTGGSGPLFRDGDRISFRDALYAMFLPSSNTVAVALSRVVGRMILEVSNTRQASPYRLWKVSVKY